MKIKSWKSLFCLSLISGLLGGFLGAWGFGVAAIVGFAWGWLWPVVERKK